MNRAETLLSAAFGDRATLAFAVTIDGEPRSKARPRFTGAAGNRRAYSDHKQVADTKRLAWHLLKACPHPIDQSVLVAVSFYRSSRHRIDLDNMIKQVLDSANRLAWRDDYLVTGLVSELHVGDECPRIELAVAVDMDAVRDRTPQTTECKQCGKAFEWTKYKSRTVAAFCSRPCAARARGEDLSEEVSCRRCGTSFRRKTARRVLCSDGCRVAEMADRTAKMRTRPRLPCVGCGAAPANTQARRCRACWRVSRKAQPVPAARIEVIT